jgi:hypothetical protein
MAVSERAKRAFIDVAVTIVFGITLVAITDKWWISLAIFPYGLWNFYDGMTRGGLEP